MPRLIVVEEAFRARGRGVLLEPRFTVEGNAHGPFQARLVLPDGTARIVRAELETSHMRGQGSVFAMIRLPELAPEDVPAGAEVWRDDA
jgi:hypothetical protein